jgi:hypothetical protein
VDDLQRIADAVYAEVSAISEKQDMGV